MNLVKGDRCDFSRLVPPVHMLKGHVPFQISEDGSTGGGSRHGEYVALCPVLSLHVASLDIGQPEKEPRTILWTQRKFSPSADVRATVGLVDMSPMQRPDLARFPPQEAI